MSIWGMRSTRAVGLAARATTKLPGSDHTVSQTCDGPLNQLPRSLGRTKKPLLCLAITITICWSKDHKAMLQAARICVSHVPCNWIKDLTPRTMSALFPRREHGRPGMRDFGFPPLYTACAIHCRPHAACQHQVSSF